MANDLAIATNARQGRAGEAVERAYGFDTG
jgi:hypothetical protein